MRGLAGVAGEAPCHDGATAAGDPGQGALGDRAFGVAHPSGAAARPRRRPITGPGPRIRVSFPEAVPRSPVPGAGDRRSRGRARYDRPGSGGPGWTMP